MKLSTSIVPHENRWMIEVMQVSRKKRGRNQILSIEYIEQRLENKINTGSEAKINQFRDETRVIAKQLEMKDEFEKLNHIISALLSTHTADAMYLQQIHLSH